LLTPLQVRLAGIVTALPKADGFALAGAGGLLVHGLIDRTTRDLDYFVEPGEEAAVADLRDAQLVEVGARSALRRRFEGGSSNLSAGLIRYGLFQV
jgi:hypothetical protein